MTTRSMATGLAYRRTRSARPELRKIELRQMATDLFGLEQVAAAEPT